MKKRYHKFIFSELVSFLFQERLSRATLRTIPDQRRFLMFASWRGSHQPIRTSPPDLAIGDVIFISVKAKPFREVAAATNSWTNHVGVVISIDGKEPLIGESTFPVSRTTTLSKFVARSEYERFAVARLTTALSLEQQQRLVNAALHRTGVLYDTGFDLYSRRQFCSRFVREVLMEATGVQVGEAQTFANLLRQQPMAKLGFWRVWYFGRIPWERVTVTPASLLQSAKLQMVFDSSMARQAAPLVCM